MTAIAVSEETYQKVLNKKREMEAWQKKVVTMGQAFDALLEVE